MGLDMERKRRAGTLPLNNGGKDIIRTYKPLFCPCCRAKVRLIAVLNRRYVFECVGCSWKSKPIEHRGTIIQGELDRMRLREKE